MNRPVHFEIQASDPEKLTKFYKDLFGWEFQEVPGMDYWLIMTGKEGPGIDGGMLKRNSASPKDEDGVNAYVCTIDVTDIDAMIKKANELKARVAMPKGPVPDIGWLTYYKDPDGNLFGMMQEDPKAK